MINKAEQMIMAKHCGAVADNIVAAIVAKRPES
jgi:hypothetical protein